MIKGLTFAQPEEQGRTVFVDSNADNLWPGNLLRLLRPARSFGRKDGGAVAESRDRETLGAAKARHHHAARLQLSWEKGARTDMHPLECVRHTPSLRNLYPASDHPH